MKTKKWIWISLAALLTLVVLVAVAGAGFRLGMTQNPAFIQQREELRAQRLNQMQKQDTNQESKSNDRMFNPHMQGFDPRGNSGRGFDSRFQSDRGFDRGRGGFFPPLFGLIHLVILGALIWFGYKYVKNSGWKLVREVQPVPVVSEPANVEEKKDEA